MWLGLGLTNGSRAEMRMHHIQLGLAFKKPSWCIFLPRELKEAKVREFFTLKHDSSSVQKYGLDFTQLSLYDFEMVKDMRSRIWLFFAGLGRALSIEGKIAMLICYMDISRLMVFV